ncbi:secondary thiamine-phosphate synthase enzyme YjbQ [Desulfogranum mediterraneum]|uniref:secondary thiamine-phosphate synthase enzyme YjbQ n=1 Tax=Desulfogranum mediterraneum TaxID=160661 RepID=UPI00048A8217|nr:secondary thiamine-phosphate synthase enzyme YjbQ [Desulfogranum mediterraneum]
MLFGTLQLSTSAPMELIDITARIQELVSAQGLEAGICTLFNPHTTAGVTINEGADPDVQDDLIGALRRIVPRDYPYKHREGNSPSHVMASLTGSSLAVPFVDGSLRLGTWQRIFFCEYDGPRQRSLNWYIQTG